MTEMRIVARCVLMLAGALACASVAAQATSAEPASSAADRAQKQADRTLYWIRVLAEKPAPKQAAAPKPAAAAPVAQAAAPAPAARTATAAADSRPPAQKVASVVTPVPSEVAAPSSTAATASRVVAAPPAATAPALSQAAAGGDASPAVAAGLAAPALTPPESDLAASAPEAEEPDPGLIMVKSADPQFPMATMRRLRKGEVEVKFEVGPDGQVDVVSVVRTTNPGLNNAALEAVRQWQFKPTPHGHTAVVDLAFDLDS